MTAYPVVPASSSTMSAYALPVTPMYPSTSTMSFRPVPSSRPLESMARRRRPRWGLRFLVLVGVAGVAAHFLRPYVKWIDDRAQLVEDTARNVSRQYGLPFFNTNPAPATTAVAPEVAAPAPRPSVEPTTAAAAKAPASAPVAAKPAQQSAAIEPLPPRSTRGALTARGAAKPEATRALLRRRPAQQASQATRAQRWAARVAAIRARRAALGLSPGAPVRPQPTMKAAALVTTAPIAAEAEEPAEQPKAAPAPAPETKAPARAVVAPEPPPPPARNVVKEAASSGDELDRLMAGAVTSHEKGGRTTRANARMAAEVERKVAQVGTQQVSRRPTADLTAPSPAAATGPQAQALDRDQIKSVMSEAQKQMSACRKQGGGQGGIADVKVDVAPDGQVKSAVVRGALAGSATGVCVETKIKALTFPASSGLRFDYPMVVR
jgi:hypothetical protein